MFDLIFIELFVVMEGNIELLQDGNRLKEERNIKLSKEDARESDTLLVGFILCHNSRELFVEFSDEAGFNQ